MLSSNQRKLITQLSKKKYRISNKLFVVEGKKVVNELIASSWPFQNLFTTEDNFHPDAEKLSLEEMKKITHFKTPSPVLGVFILPEVQKLLVEPITIAQQFYSVFYRSKLLLLLVTMLLLHKFCTLIV